MSAEPLAGAPTGAAVPTLGAHLAIAVASVVPRDPHARFKSLAADLVRTLENMCVHAERCEWPACAVIEVRTSALVREIGRLVDADPGLRTAYRELLTLTVATTEALLVQCRETRRHGAAAADAIERRDVPDSCRYLAVR
ncbi:MAG: hypothetical protein R3F45_01310 [Gammaproteobacteria bacterium]